MRIMRFTHYGTLYAMSVFLAAGSLLSCGRTVDVIMDCRSPDGTATATFYWVHGGGAAGWAFFRVAVRDSAESLQADRYQFAMRHGYHVRLTWRTPSELLIEYPDKAVVDLQEAQVHLNGGRIIKFEYVGAETVPVNSLRDGNRCSTAAPRAP
jgi:hypothetical protein